jgi:hypothetical protein
MKPVNSSNWADAKLAERRAFNRISDGRSQAEWLELWKAWILALGNLREKAKHPGPEREADSELVEAQSSQVVFRLEDAP